MQVVHVGEGKRRVGPKLSGTTGNGLRQRACADCDVINTSRDRRVPRYVIQWRQRWTHGVLRHTRYDPYG